MTIPQTSTAAADWFGGAVGNIDTDSTYDTWTIGTTGRVSSGCDAPTNISSGEPANDTNDVSR